MPEIGVIMCQYQLNRVKIPSKTLLTLQLSVRFHSSFIFLSNLEFCIFLFFVLNSINVFDRDFYPGSVKS